MDWMVFCGVLYLYLEIRKRDVGIVVVDLIGDLRLSEWMDGFVF